MSKSIQRTMIVEYDLKSLSKVYRAKVKRVYKAFWVVSAPSARDFESLMQLNLMKGRKDTAEDANLSKKVCTSNTRSFKEKSAKSKPVPFAGSIAKILDVLVNTNK